MLKVLATVEIVGELADVAMRGARYGFPGWVTETTQKNGKTKYGFLEKPEAEQRASDYLARAIKPGEIVGRQLALLAIATYADQNAVPGRERRDPQAEGDPSREPRRTQNRARRDRRCDRRRTARQRPGDPQRGDRIWIICDLEPAVMTTATVTESRRNGNHVGERVKLGRYQTAAGETRVLYGQRVGTVVRITDIPVDRPGRAYLVERGLEQDGYAALLAIVRDYLDQANQLGIPPMATTVLG